MVFRLMKLLFASITFASILVAAGNEELPRPREDTLRTSDNTQTFHEKIRWVTRDQLTVRSDLVEGGSEDGIPQYVGRGLVKNVSTEWVPGKAISINNGNFIVHSSFFAKEYIFSSGYQFLIASPGATSWVTTTSMPRNAVIGGNDPLYLDITHVCRAVYDDKLMIGKMFANPRICKLPYNGTEIDCRDSVQVLVAN